MRPTARRVTFLAWLAPLCAGSTPPKTFELDGHRLKLPAAIEFETGGDAVRPSSAPALEHVAAYLAAKPSVSLVRVEVHSDNQGDDAANQALTDRRSLAVARELVARGADCKRLLPVGFGETKPVAPSDTAEGRAANRRVEVVNAALLGRAIGGMPVDGGGRVAGDPCR